LSEWIGVGVSTALLCVPMAAIVITVVLTGRRRR
jgi:hypothetical protein